MINIKDRTYVPILATSGTLSGKQNGIACPVVMDENNSGCIMFVQAGVPVEDLTLSREGMDFSSIYLDLKVAGKSFRLFSDISITVYSFTFQDDYTFYCDAELSVEG